MYACNVYDVTEEFAENCRQEAIDNLKRLRHHASLGLICGNNEIESAWLNWKDFAQNHLTSRQIISNCLKMSYQKPARRHWYLIELLSFFGGRFDNPDDENNGDTHYWRYGMDRSFLPIIGTITCFVPNSASSPSLV